MAQAWHKTVVEDSAYDDLLFADVLYKELWDARMGGFLNDLGAKAMQQA